MRAGRPVIEFPALVDLAQVSAGDWILHHA
jgi:hypothetical protein